MTTFDVLPTGNPGRIPGGSQGDPRGYTGGDRVGNLEGLAYKGMQRYVFRSTNGFSLRRFLFEYWLSFAAFCPEHPLLEMLRHIASSSAPRTFSKARSNTVRSACSWLVIPSSPAVGRARLTRLLCEVNSRHDVDPVRISFALGSPHIGQILKRL